MTQVTELVTRIKRCPRGKLGWCQFEDDGTEALRHLFIPPLSEPKIQARTQSGVHRRDAVFPNRNFNSSNIWGHLYHELDARMILFEFKNYDKKKIGAREVTQIRDYLSEPMGRLAIICSRGHPNSSALIMRNRVYTETKRVILFMTEENLVEMLFMKERGDDPSNLVMDLVEDFYLKYG